MNTVGLHPRPIPPLPSRASRSRWTRDRRGGSGRCGSRCWISTKAMPLSASISEKKSLESSDRPQRRNADDRSEAPPLSSGSLCLGRVCRPCPWRYVQPRSRPGLKAPAGEPRAGSCGYSYLRRFSGSTMCPLPGRRRGRHVLGAQVSCSGCLCRCATVGYGLNAAERDRSCTALFPPLDRPRLCDGRDRHRA